MVKTLLLVKAAFPVKALFPVKVLFPVIALSPAAPSLCGVLLFFRQVQTLCHGIAGITEPLILISLFSEFSAALQMSGYVSTDDGGNPFRAS